jgi:cellulose synthase/poly-beta-1,6-N-acetylglucosamine synthase-like glycosyltransferase
VLVVVTIIASVAALAGFAFYVCWFTGMAPFSKVFYLGLLGGLFYCALAYQLNRFGAAVRAIRHRPFDASRYDYLFDAAAPSLTVLIPSYREERRVVQMTVLSAALARYADRRIAVLVDDPPGDPASVNATVSAVREIAALLGEPMARLRAEHEGWCARLAGGEIAPADELVRLVNGYRFAARWLDDLASRMTAEIKAEFVHVDQFVIDNIVRAPAAELREYAARLFERVPTRTMLDREYRRLGTLFCTEISTFERKRFANLSHASNKASNLNAYIGLMGGRFRVRDEGGEALIEPVGADETADLEVERPDYVLTLDADSVIRGSYMVELVDLLEQRTDLAVAQTPYLTFPGARSWVERVAGATTDVQYLVHQGSTHFGAAFWVGANAIIRFRALAEIARDTEEQGHSHRVFIQDETVIEDTGSTVDLLRGGWSVYNHFTPLAYSATPADFGALTIQRKRWSNGGLIILPQLLGQFLAQPGRGKRLLELFLRANYLLSPAIGNIAVFLLMIWATTDGRTLVFTPLVMVPHFILYGLDLRRLGYRFRDIFTVCALNLMLLPVAFAGVAMSVLQMITGRKGAFIRTPKVANRTLVPPVFFLFNLLMSLLMLRFVVEGVITGDYVGTIVPAINVTFYVYGMARFVGLDEGFADLLRVALGWWELAYRPFAGRVEAFLERLAGAVTAVDARLVGAAVFAFAVIMPWHIGPSLIEADLARAAVVATTGKTVVFDGVLPVNGTAPASLSNSSAGEDGE